MKVYAYLNFDGDAEEAFLFYKSVLGGELESIMKMSEAPDTEKLSSEEKDRTMHISLRIDPDTLLMGSDTLPSMGQELHKGNNLYISLHPRSKDEADRIFNGLSEGGFVEMPIKDQFWGDYFGSLTDKFGVNWMVNYNEEL